MAKNDDDDQARGPGERLPADPRTASNHPGYTDDDRRKVRQIADTSDGVDLARLIHAYYGDLDRADRTPRGVLYFHLGLLAGLLDRVLQERP